MPAPVFCVSWCNLMWYFGGAQELLLWRTNFFVKQPQGTEIPYHQVAVGETVSLMTPPVYPC